MRTLALVLYISYGLYAQSLDDLILQAVAKNPQLKALHSQTQLLEKHAKAVSYLPDPMVSTTWMANEIVTANGPQTLQATVRQEFPAWGSLDAQSALFSIHAQMKTEQRKTVQSSLMMSIKTSYYQLAFLQETKELLTHYALLLDGFSTSALTRYEHGTGVQQDVLKVQAERASISNRQLMVQRSIRREMSNLNQLTYGNHPEISAVFPDSSALILETDIEQTHTVQQFRKQLEAAKMKETLASKKSLPSVSLGFMYGMIDEKKGVTGNKDALGFTVGFSVPLWFGKNSAVNEAAERGTQEAHYSLQTQMKASLETRRLIKDELELIKQSLHLLQQNLIPKAQLTLQASIGAYETGKGSFLNLLDAQRMLLTFSEQRLMAKKDYWQFVAQYENETMIIKD